LAPWKYSSKIRPACSGDPGSAGTEAQVQPLGVRLGGELVLQTVEQGLHRQARDLGNHRPGIQPGDVENAPEQCLHGDHGCFDLVQRGSCGQPLHLGLHGFHVKGDGMHRLAQIMAGGCQEPGLGLIGLLRLLFSSGQFGGRGINAILHVLLKRLQGLTHAVDTLLQFPELAGGGQGQAHPKPSAGDAPHGTDDLHQRPDADADEDMHQDHRKHHPQSHQSRGREQLVACYRVIAGPAEGHLDPADLSDHRGSLGLEEGVVYR